MSSGAFRLKVFFYCVYDTLRTWSVSDQLIHGAAEQLVPKRGVRLLGEMWHKMSPLKNIEITCEFLQYNAIFITSQGIIIVAISDIFASKS